MQLVISQLELLATPPELFAKRMSIEADVFKKSGSNIYALQRGQEWLQTQTKE